jgi:hypothetical protein
MASEINNRPGVTTETYVKKCSGCGKLDKVSGGPLDLMACSRCELVFYCSRDCQAKDWGTHKGLCKGLRQALENKQNNKPILENVIDMKQMTVADMMRSGMSVSMDINGNTLNSEKATTELATSLENSSSKAATVIRVTVAKVKAAEGEKTETIEVAALLSLGSDVSAMSDRLAEKLGITAEGLMTVSGFQQDDCGASFPSHCVSVTCPETRDAASKPIDMPKTHLAPVIMSNAVHELVLGRDFVQELNKKLSCEAIIKCRPDASFLLFNTSGAIKAVMRLPWGRTDRGPCYRAVENLPASDLEPGTIVRPDAASVVRLRVAIASSYQ